jgi:alpha-galactosidase
MAAIAFSNKHLELALHPERGAWSVHSRQFPDAALLNVRMGLAYRQGLRRRQDLLTFPRLIPGKPEDVETAQGPARQVQIEIESRIKTLCLRLLLRLPQDSPLLHWQVELHNRGPEPLQIDKIEMLRAGFVTVSSSRLGFQRSATGQLQLHNPHGDLAFFANGWQSWNYSGVYGYHEHFKRTRLGPFTAPMRVNAGTSQPRQRGHFASDFYGVLGDRTHRIALLAGFLSQQQHFGSLEAYLDPHQPAVSLWANGDRAVLPPGAQVATDWACVGFLHLDTPDPLAPYLEAVARQHGLLPELSPFPVSQVPAGWCSWYHYFQEISEGIIQANLHTAENLQHKLPLDLIQIDDGYQSEVGDWLTFKESFPQGPAPLAREIRAAGYTPGIWLAPFILHPRARLAAEHPQWLLRNRRGQPVNAGFVWNTFTRALDLTNPEALEYACQVIDTAAHAWGFSYLKLDFLYAAALPGRYQDQTRTRAQALRQALEALRASAGPEVTLLGCGCPLGPGLGLFDAMRIGADVAPHWHPRYFNTELYFKPEPDFPSARNAIHNTLVRAPLHRRWWINDPDCLLVRPDSRLTLAEVQTLATSISLTGGSLLLSDDLAALPEERLRLARSLLPLIGQRPHILDWFDHSTPTRLQLNLEGPEGEWHLLALFNWQDRPADLILQIDDFYLDRRQAYLGREFWSGRVLQLGADPFRWESVPAHGCLLLALRPRRSRPRYIGSDLHISQGQEITAWQWEEHRGSLQLQRPGPAEGVVDLFLPGEPQQATLNGVPLDWQPTRLERVYRFPLAFHTSASVEIQIAG